MANLHPEVFLRLYFSESEMIGPGKAALLEGIAATGSISAAGRDMGMSYKRAWSLVETMNAMFRDPLVESCLLYTSPSPRDKRQSRMPSSA